MTNTGPSDQSKPAWTHFFPERQFYYRSEGAVRYLTFSPRMQVLGVVLGVVLAGWLVYVSADFVLGLSGRGMVSAALLREDGAYRKSLQQARAREAAALSLLEEKTVAFERVTGEFEQRHQVLRFLLEGLRHDENLAVSLDEKGRESVLIRATIDEAAPRRNRVSRAASASDADNVQDRVEQIGQAQLQFLDIAEQTLVERREYWLGVLEQTGIEVGQLIRQANTGGPGFELALPEDMAADHPFYVRARQVVARFEEARLIDELMEFVPLGNPVGAPSRRTSVFGRRLDPFTGRPAWHSGVDITAYPDAPIIATAPGRVSHAGRKSGYGNVVEIDHGFGFKSRYGHLRTITVSLGEQLQKGQQVGTMGSSGRSTGVHLHYEISFNGKIYDPARFFEAGRYVKGG